VGGRGIEHIVDEDRANNLGIGRQELYRRGDVLTGLRIQGIDRPATGHGIDRVADRRVVVSATSPTAATPTSSSRRRTAGRRTGGRWTTSTAIAISWRSREGNGTCHCC